MISSYQTISQISEGTYTQLRSKFIALAVPVSSEEEVQSHLQNLKREYYDARHICWAYRLGADGARSRQNDDGEPSGTAGKPIMGQIVSRDLTEVMVVVVRYFGGVKLGTSGLIEAYRSAAHEALEAATIVERIVERPFEVYFGYELMGEVMRLVKDSEARIITQDFVESCRLELSLRADEAEVLYARLDALYGTTVRYRDED